MSAEPEKIDKRCASGEHVSPNPDHGDPAASLDTASAAESPASGVADPFKPLWERGISREVAEARGYVPYYGKQHPLHDHEAVRAELAPYNPTPEQKATNTRFTNNAVDDAGRLGHGDGLIMRKHPVPGADPFEPQLRPRHPVPTGSKTRHRHDKHFDDPARLRKHIEQKHGGGDVATWHTHDNLAKYLLPSRAKHDVEHDHATDRAFQGAKGDKKLRAHLRAHHDGIDVEGPHTHRRDKPGQNAAKRLDIHPWALERLAHAERVYFSIEGTPKADAILSKIIETGMPDSGFDVPSVTLWKAPELEEFARALLAPEFFTHNGKRVWPTAAGLIGDASGLFERKKKLVVVVPDADWFTNDKVVRQALLCRESLGECGVAACIAASPIESGHKGVDDFLAAGGDLDDLQVLDREAPFSLALHAGEDGTIRGTIWGLATILGVQRDAERVVATLRNHIHQGWINVDRDLRLIRDEWSGEIDWEGTRAEWPTITICNDLRYTEQFHRLGDYSPVSFPTTREDAFYDELEKAWVETPGAIGKRHATAAISSLAARLGISERAVRKMPAVVRLLRENELERERMIHVAHHEWGKDADEIATMLHVSARTVARTLNDSKLVERHNPKLMIEERNMSIAPVPTDEKMAQDAETLAMILALAIEISGRMLQRFPGDLAVANAVEKFLETARRPARTELNIGTDREAV